MGTRQVERADRAGTCRGTSKVPTEGLPACSPCLPFPSWPCQHEARWRTGALELGTTESFVGMSFMVVTDTDGHQWLTNTDTGDETLWFTIGTTHTGLQSISTGT